jgi:hypothetical protein
MGPGTGENPGSGQKKCCIVRCCEVNCSSAVRKSETDKAAFFLKRSRYYGRCLFQQGSVPVTKLIPASLFLSSSAAGTSVREHHGAALYKKHCSSCHPAAGHACL